MIQNRDRKDYYSVSPCSFPGYRIILGLGLHKGTENSLLAKLNTAVEKLEDGNAGNDAAVVNLLEAFINVVEAQGGKKISWPDADGLIAAAQEIIELLGDE